MNSFPTQQFPKTSTQQPPAKKKSSLRAKPKHIEQNFDVLFQSNFDDIVDSIDSHYAQAYQLSSPSSSKHSSLSSNDDRWINNIEVIIKEVESAEDQCS